MDMDNEIIDNQSEEVAVAAAAAAVNNAGRCLDCFVAQLDEARKRDFLVAPRRLSIANERLSPSSLPLLWRDKPMLEADTAWSSSKPDRAPNLQTRLR